MPNWAEGNIRLRGKRENIIDFLKHELCAVADGKDGYCSEERPVTVTDNCGGWSIIVKRDPDTHGHFYFKESNRQFIFTDSNETEIELGMSEGPNLNKDQIVFIDNFNGAWDVDDEIFKEYSKKYKIDIRVFVWELGMAWSSVKTFYKDGRKDFIYHSYSDWMWDCPMPNYGG